MKFSLEKKTFTFPLKQSLKTSKGVLSERKGWIVKIISSTGKCGWGEIAPLRTAELEQCQNIFNTLGPFPKQEQLEESIQNAPGAFGFGIGSALADIEEISSYGRPQWHLQAPRSAILLPSNESLLSKLTSLIESTQSNNKKLTIKWKVAIEPNYVEEKLRDAILELLPKGSRLRIDANSGWDRKQASSWANYFSHDSRLEWLEEPLPINDLEGLIELSKQVPIALDESLIDNPLLKNNWKGWKIRHPSIEGDPRLLLKELQLGANHISISTAFETGIGRRCINHLAALQQRTPTPTSPGLAPGWRPKGNLFSDNSISVWEAI